jgi:hypothetical protein
MKTKVLLATVAAAALVAVGAGLVTAGADASPPDEIQAAKAAAARYHSFEQALADGYTIAGEPCVQEAAGAMGIHAVNHTLAGDLTIDPLRPEILLYLPDGNRNLRLVGVEYFTVALTPTGQWFGSEPPDGGFVNPAPTVFGQTFDGPMPGHNPSMPWHYDLHVWLWADNPSGQFAPFNPAHQLPVTQHTKGGRDDRSPPNPVLSRGAGNARFRSADRVSRFGMRSKGKRERRDVRRSRNLTRAADRQRAASAAERSTDKEEEG